MKNKSARPSYLLFTILMLLIISCKKNDTKYFVDGEDPSLAIFSNTGNNVMSCFANGRTWRTNDRVSYTFGGKQTYEVDIDVSNRFAAIALRDTLTIKWKGRFADEAPNSINSYFHLTLFLPHSTLRKNFSDLQGQRLHIDGSNGWFTTRINTANNGAVNGTGDIYFQQVRLDSIGVNNYRGSMSGLFEADFGATQITKGRFDHTLNGDQFTFY